MTEMQQHVGRAPVKLALIVALAIAALATVAGPVASAGSPATSGTRTSSIKPTIVLVHGAWADSSAWEVVTGRLQRDGFSVVSFPNPLRGLASDSAYLASFLQTVVGPVVLVGHSYAGAVITNAASGNSAVKALVYVDAFIPDSGETVLQLASAEPGSCVGGNPTTVFNVVPIPGPPPDADLYARQQPNAPYPGFARCFANDLTTTAGAVLAAAQRPIALSALLEPSGGTAWKTIPSWAFVGTVDNVLPPAEQMFMAQRAHARITTARASHLSMVSHPEVVTDVIEDAAQATA